jgi:hypothetical protein
MNEALRISPLPPDLPSQDFELLRSRGLSVIQSLAAETWTDHNLHDPGITLLEAACYALTEAGLRAGMEMKDLLASSALQRPPELFTAARVLPVAPVTSVDLRKILGDHPLIDNAWVFPLMPVPLGRSSVLLEFADPTLNSNLLTIDVVPPGLAGPYRVALAFPHWDEPDVQAFREDVALQAVTFSGPPGGEWTDIEGSEAYFTRATVTYQPSVGGPEDLELWVVARIGTPMADSAVEAPQVLDATIAALGDLGASGSLKALNQRVIRAFETMRRVRRYLSPHRNLCEDFVEFNAVRIQEVGVSAIVEVGGGVAVEELLAEIFFRIDRMIAPVVRPYSLAERLEQLGSADAVFDGPLTGSGFVDSAEMDAQRSTDAIYTSDILRLIYQLRHADGTDVLEREEVSARRIVAVRNLTLSNHIDNRPITTRARDCLRLVRSHRHVPRLSLDKSRIVLFRNGVEIEYDVNRVAELLEERKRTSATADLDRAADLPVPAGEAHPIGEYYPIQNDLPAAYGVGEAGLPDHATVTRRAQARQLKGYLFLFEQMLAGYHSQLVHFNTYFSSDPGVRRTLFQQPLYHLPDIEPLFKGHDPQAMSWTDFQNDSDNPYARVLSGSVETRDQFLERRNALLDHLLASVGEDLLDRSALLFRLAAEVPGSTALALPDLLEARRRRRLETLDDLIEDKSDYYHDVPELNRTRGQAHGHPLWRSARLRAIARSSGGYEWSVSDGAGTTLLRHFAPADSIPEAERVMEEALRLATRADRYTVRLEAGGARRLEVRPSGSDDPLAESVQTFPNLPDAQAAIGTMAAAVLGLWTSHALVSLEWRLLHLLGVDVRGRRMLAHEIDDYLEIFDEAVNPNNEKGFRLWELPGSGGDELLVNVASYPAPTAAEAAAAARADARLLGVHGTDMRNYAVEDAGPGSFAVVLRRPDGSALARSPIAHPSPESAAAAAKRIRLHVYGLFSGEGCHLVEHPLLFPRLDTDPALVVGDLDDPYSFQITVILPSGFARDFSQPNGPVESAQPALYRSAEFRNYVERQVRKFCPAQVLARVLWVDRARSGTPVAATDPSLDALELAYFDWLAEFLTDEPDPAALDARRNALTGVMNALYEEYYPTD